MNWKQKMNLESFFSSLINGYKEKICQILVLVNHGELHMVEL